MPEPSEEEIRRQAEELAAIPESDLVLPDRTPDVEPPAEAAAPQPTHPQSDTQEPGAVPGVPASPTDQGMAEVVTLLRDLNLTVLQIQQTIMDVLNAP